MIEDRRAYSDQRFGELIDALANAAKTCEAKACVYATGSFGRREASQYSDVDLFIVSLCDQPGKEQKGRLSKLDEILLKADLIRATRKLGFPDFSKGGDYLQHHPANRLIEATGDRNDDATNTFTARLLLLLESKPLVGAGVHGQVIDDVIAKYWREFPEHNDSFMPAYLANDILRFWRTLCLNYEASTHEQTVEDRAKRKIKNYKLKHSRLLTCYSAILYLLYVYSIDGTVTVEVAKSMVSLNPTQRLQWLATKLQGSETADDIFAILKGYERFLDVTSSPEEDLIARFLDNREAHQLRSEQSEFGDLVYKLLLSVGRDSKFYRRLVV